MVKVVEILNTQVGGKTTVVQRRGGITNAIDVPGTGSKPGSSRTHMASNKHSGELMDTPS